MGIITQIGSPLKARNPKERNPKERKIKARTHKSGTHKSEPKRAESKIAKSLKLKNSLNLLSCMLLISMKISRNIPTRNVKYLVND